MTLVPQALDDIAGQQVADHGAAQNGRNSPSWAKVPDREARQNYQHEGDDPRRAIDRQLVHPVEAGPGQRDIGLPELGRVLSGVGGFADPPSEQLPRDAAPLERGPGDAAGAACGGPLAYPGSSRLLRRRQAEIQRHHGGHPEKENRKRHQVRHPNNPPARFCTSRGMRTRRARPRSGASVARNGCETAGANIPG